jgi:hypothetical protein
MNPGPSNGPGFASWLRYPMLATDATENPRREKEIALIELRVF